MKIMFFEDAFTWGPNIKFRLELREELPHIELNDAGSVKFFEDLLKLNIYDAFILDIISTETNIKNMRTGKKIEKIEVGIELLERLRSGYYTNQKKDALIIMRTARATEPDIRAICLQKGANFCVSPGSDNHKIINILKEYFSSKKGQL